VVLDTSLPIIGLLDYWIIGLLDYWIIGLLRSLSGDIGLLESIFQSGNSGEGLGKVRVLELNDQIGDERLEMRTLYDVGKLLWPNV
jgi:hypothetical protein